MPFTYVVHVRTFLLIYLLGLPFILVSDLDWVMLVAVLFVGYLMFGLENTAVQLENPFGTDCNHHPLDLYCLEVLQDLLHLLDLRASTKAAAAVEPASKEPKVVSEHGITVSESLRRRKKDREEEYLKEEDYGVDDGGDGGD